MKFCNFAICNVGRGAGGVTAPAAQHEIINNITSTYPTHAMSLFEKLIATARGKRQRIVLPEGLEPRTLTAADRIIADGIADITLIGDPAEIDQMAKSLSLSNLSKARVVNPADRAVIDTYAPLFFELRKSKGITMEQARMTTANPLYLGCLLVKAGEADGMVAGAMNTTGNVLRSAFQVIKTRKGIEVVSGAFLMLIPEGMPYGENGVLVFADCAVVPDPTAKELAQIAVSAAQTARDIACIEPRVAMMSFSTKGSAKHERVDKVIEASRIAKAMCPALNVDGELQSDAAIVPGVAASKPPAAPSTALPTCWCSPRSKPATSPTSLCSVWEASRLSAPSFRVWPLRSMTSRADASPRISTRPSSSPATRLSASRPA